MDASTSDGEDSKELRSYLHATYGWDNHNESLVSNFLLTSEFATSSSYHSPSFENNQLLEKTVNMFRSPLKKKLEKRGQGPPAHHLTTDTTIKSMRSCMVQWLFACPRTLSSPVLNAGNGGCLIMDWMIVPSRSPCLAPVDFSWIETLVAGFFRHPSENYGPKSRGR